MHSEIVRSQYLVYVIEEAVVNSFTNYFARVHTTISRVGQSILTTAKAPAAAVSAHPFENIHMYWLTAAVKVCVRFLLILFHGLRRYLRSSRENLTKCIVAATTTIAHCYNWIDLLDKDSHQLSSHRLCHDAVTTRTLYCRDLILMAGTIFRRVTSPRSVIQIDKATRHVILRTN